MQDSTVLSYLQRAVDTGIEPQHYQFCMTGNTSARLTLRYHTGVQNSVVADGLQTYLRQVMGIPDMAVECATQVMPHQISNHVQGKAGIKNIIAISSGKGGVGKSTVTTNVAMALQQLGAKVGIIDADIHGPSQPTMLGVTNADLAARTSGLAPVDAHGVYSASIRYFMTTADPVMWRGPMVSRALEQMVHDITWPALDYLLIDMPPGTGDIALTLVKKLPVTAALVVTTPQIVACLDAQKAAQMFLHVKMPILGIVENMASYQCPHCATESKVFGQGGGQQLAQELSLPMLAQMPLLSTIQEGADEGIPGVLSDRKAYDAYRALAIKIGQQLALRPLDSMRS